MVLFLKDIPPCPGSPETILVIRAHWEAFNPRVTTRRQPRIIYNYSGFSNMPCQITYPEVAL